MGRKPINKTSLDRWLQQFYSYPHDKTIAEIQDELRPYANLIRQLIRDLPNRWRDARAGSDIMGGYPTAYKIRNNLQYISDRWYCYHRLRWLLDLLDVDASKLPPE